MQIKAEKFYRIKTIIISIFIMTLAGIVICKIADLENNNNFSGKQNLKEINKNNYITLWYSDDLYDDYIKEAVKAYEKDTGKIIKYKKVSSIDYLEQINKSNKNKIKMQNTSDFSIELDYPDVYICDCESLEAAYGYGMADVCSGVTKANGYLENAINNVTYKGKAVAYPLDFDVAFLAYNKIYVNKIPKTFDDIIDFSDEFDSTGSNVSKIIDWDTSSLMCNYGFVGNYMIFGGKCGDDETSFNLNNTNSVSALQYYKKFIDRFGINSDSDEKYVDEFALGKSLFSVINFEQMCYVEEKYPSFDFAICDYPDISNEYSTSTLSSTDAVVVNYLSDNKDESKKIAKYLSCDQAELIKTYLHKMPVINKEYTDLKLNIIENAYEKSAILPKLMTASDYFLQLENVFLKTMRGEEISSLLSNLSSMYKIRIE